MSHADPQAARPGPAGSAATPLLAVRRIGIRFGGIVALNDVSFDLAAGQILGLIGPNGAGKTTLFNCLSRLYTPDTGDILFEAKNILTEPAQNIARIGITRTFQNLALFRTLSVIDNVRIGAHGRSRSDFVSDALRLPWVRAQERATDAVVTELLTDLGLDDVAHRIVADLPTGTQKRVELARALAGRPKLILLDEPASGLNHNEVGELGRLVCHIRDTRGVTVLLVEHHMAMVMSVSDKVVALDFGAKIAEGTPDTVRNDPEVIRAYLGGGQ